MAAAGKTARGLRRVPAYQPPKEEQKPSRKPRQRKIKYKVFSLGQGLDMPLFIFILVLLAIGLVMLFSASYAYAYYNDGSSYAYISRQGMFAVLGVAAMLFISTFDYHHYHKFAWPVMGVAVLFLCLVMLFKALGLKSLAPNEGDAYRWLQLGPINFQPSEVAKFAVILLFSHLISQNLDKMGTFYYGVLPYVAILGVVGGLIFLENHLSATLIVLMLGAILMFVGGTKLRWFLLGGGTLAVLLIIMLFFGDSYQASRVDIWLDPFSPDLDPDLTWQTRQSLYAIGSGGFLGVGLGQSRQKYLWLPEPQNDFIFAVVCEELGLLGALVIMVLFGLLIWRGVYVSLHARDKFGMLLGLGITFQVGLQAVLNICVVTNTIPNTGISLPFFSYGGTALLMLLGEMGVLLNISRSSNVEKT